MGENGNPVARLKAIGIELPVFKQEMGAKLSPFLLDGQRLLISAVPPYHRENQPVPRLNMDANIDLDTDMASLADDHPIRLAMNASRLAAIRALSVAQAAVGGDLSAISHCLRAVLNIKSGPNFERLGMVSLPVNRVFTTAFRQGPIFNIAGVAALPGGAALTLETEFRLRA